MSTIDIACLRFSKPKAAYTIWSWRQRFHGDIVRRGRKAYRIVEKVGFFSYLATPYKWHAHR
jgi:type IV secretory pathway TrbL component